jgi:hexokinase
MLLQKLISGRYLGEILRLVLCELIDEGVLFLGQETYKLEKPYAFDTAFLSLMERYVVLPTFIYLTCSCSQRSYGRAVDDHRHLRALLRYRNDPG